MLAIYKSRSEAQQCINECAAEIYKNRARLVFLTGGWERIGQKRNAQRLNTIKESDITGIDENDRSC